MNKEKFQLVRYKSLRILTIIYNLQSLSKNTVLIFNSHTMEGVTIKIEEDFVEYTSDIKPFVLDKWKEDEYADRIIISDMSESPDKMSLFFDLASTIVALSNYKALRI